MQVAARPLTASLAAAIAAAVGCASAARVQPAQEAPVLGVPPPRSERIAIAPEPSLRLLARLEGPLSETPKLFRDAGIVTSCQKDGGACVLRNAETLVAAPDFERFSRPEAVSDVVVISLSGPWPRRAWMGARFTEPLYRNSTQLMIFEWMAAGWIQRVELSSTSTYLGVGEWLGGRLITPVIDFYYDRYAARADGEIPRVVGDNPRFVVLSGPPSAELPLIDADSNLFPLAFASFPSGHAFLVSERGDQPGVHVDRWKPGERRPTREVIPGLRSAGPRRQPWENEDVDPASILLASSPDEVYVAGAGMAEGGDEGPAISRFDGRAWHTTSLPTPKRSLSSFGRGPDGALWFICGNPDGSSGELWRSVPRGALSRAALPRLHAAGGVVEEVHPLVVWPIAAGQARLLARFGRRGAKDLTWGLLHLNLAETNE